MRSFYRCVRFDRYGVTLDRSVAVSRRSFKGGSKSRRINEKFRGLSHRKESQSNIRFVFLVWG